MQERRQNRTELFGVVFRNVMARAGSAWLASPMRSGPGRYQPSGSAVMTGSAFGETKKNRCHHFCADRASALHGLEAGHTVQRGKPGDPLGVVKGCPAAHIAAAVVPACGEAFVPQAGH
uniref:Uncharacterized protein n=1 Tax=Micrococcus sp. MG-2010-D12 TaxID=936902 RepID=A0A0F6WFH5_9MICC|nr:hypothetical protein pJD12_240 [Micrococcus sp. MG-2010-D12]